MGNHTNWIHEIKKKAKAAAKAKRARRPQKRTPSCGSAARTAAAQIALLFSGAPTGKKRTSFGHLKGILIFLFFFYGQNCHLIE